MDVAAAVLALLYTFVLCLGLNQLYRLMNSKNNKLSLRTGILCFLTLGPVIRVAFWCKVASRTSWPNQLRTAVFFAPVCVLLMGYSLLVVFYAATLSETRSRRPLQYAIAVNAVFLVLTMTMSVLIEDPDSSDKTKQYVEIIFFSLKACLDIASAALLCYFGHKFATMQFSHLTVSTRILPRSPKLFSYVNWVLILASLSRGAFNISIITFIGPNQRLGIRVGDTRQETPPFYAFFFFVTEMVPALCIFLTLWKRPSPKSKNNETTPPTTAAERAVVSSVEEQNEVVVRHFRKEEGSPRPASDWWYNDVVKATLAGPNSFHSGNGPTANEDTSDDDYMMFTGVVHPECTTGDKVKISNIRHNRGHVDVSSASPTPPTDPYQIHPGGLPPIKVPHKFALESGLSKVAGGAGTPPCFNTWAKLQPGQSDSPLSSLTNDTGHRGTQRCCNSANNSGQDTDSRCADIRGNATSETEFTNSRSRIVPSISTYLAHPGGLSLQVNSNFNMRDTTDTAEVTPSFDAWYNMNQGSSVPPALSTGVPASCPSGPADPQGSCDSGADNISNLDNNLKIDVATDLKSVVGIPPSLGTWMQLERGSSSAALSNSTTPASRSSEQISPVTKTEPPVNTSAISSVGNSEGNLRISISLNDFSSCGTSENSITDSQGGQVDQGTLSAAFDDYLSPRDILLAQQKKATKPDDCFYT